MRYRGMKAAALLSCVAANLPVSSWAADCAQLDAIYTDPSGTYELRFVPLNSEAAAASGRFHVTVAGLGTAMDGFVMPADDPISSDGILMFGCPQGDATGAEISACTVWQGKIHGTTGEGVDSNLQAENGRAASGVVLTGFGKALRLSRLWSEGKVSVAPGDVLTFKECAG